MQRVYTETLRIKSYQTDVNARLRPAALLEMMQEAAGAHAEILGIGRAALLEKNLVWILTRIEVRMTRYPVFGSTMTIETFPMPNRRWFFPRSFIFRDEDGNQIGCASSLWALLDVNTRKMSKPDPVICFMPDNSDLTPPLGGMPATVAEAAGIPVIAVYHPVYTDLDMNQHVNNTRYLDWCCNALGLDVMKSAVLSTFELNYHQEVLPGQEIRTELRCSEGQFSFSGFADEVRRFDVGGILTPIASI